MNAGKIIVGAVQIVGIIIGALGLWTLCFVAGVIKEPQSVGDRIEATCRREFVAEGDVLDCRSQLMLEHVIAEQNKSMERARSY